MKSDAKFNRHQRQDENFRITSINSATVYEEITYFLQLHKKSSVLRMACTNRKKTPFLREGADFFVKGMVKALISVS